MKFHKLIVKRSKLSDLLGFVPTEVKLLRDQNMLGQVDSKKTEELLRECLLQIRAAVDVGFVYTFERGCMIGCWEDCIIRFIGEDKEKSFVIKEIDGKGVDLIPKVEVGVNKYNHKEVSSILYHTSPFISTLFNNSLEMSVV